MSKRQPRLTTVPAGKPPVQRRKASPPRRAERPLPPPKRPPVPKPHVAHIIDEPEASLVDVIDNLLNRGVVLTADVILALADVDLVYLRLSAVLCAADRVLPPTR